MKATRLTARHAARATSTATALALCAVLVSVAPASADTGTVLALGRNVDGMCVFDDPVVVTSSARTDADCRLVSMEDLNDLNASAPANVRPKMRETDATPSGGGTGIEPISLQDTEDLAGAATGLIGAASNGYRYYQAWARWNFKNEHDERIYNDSIVFNYRRDAQGDMITHAVMSDGTCQTGLVSAPHRPAIPSCSYHHTIYGTSLFSFTSKGAYTDHLLNVPYDARNLSMTFTAYGDGTFSRACSPLTKMPVGWSTSGCDIGTTQVA